MQKVVRAIYLHKDITRKMLLFQNFIKHVFKLSIINEEQQHKYT